MSKNKEVILSPYVAPPINLSTIKKWVSDLEERNASFGDWITSGDTIVIKSDEDKYLICKIEMTAKVDDGK